VRLAVTPQASRMVLAPKLAGFVEQYPDVVLDITSMGESRVDIVAAGFDAGVRLGEFIERDMIAVRVSPDQRAAIVAAPRYFTAHAKPKSPRDLPSHRCINFRHGAEEIYRWEFEKGTQSLAVAVSGPLIVNDADALIRAAVDGIGLAFMLEAQAAPHLATGELVRVLEDWCPPFAGYFLYYPSRRQQPPALAALIETLRL
jgi:DNA-binding transcriptional LysR family regulator